MGFWCIPCCTLPPLPFYLFQRPVACHFSSGLSIASSRSNSPAGILPRPLAVTSLHRLSCFVIMAHFHSSFILLIEGVDLGFLLKLPLASTFSVGFADSSFSNRLCRFIFVHWSCHFIFVRRLCHFIFIRGLC